MLSGLTESLERQFGAHVTTSTEQQWVKGALPVGTPFDIDRASDLERLAPDCEYQLRAIEIDAVGEIRQKADGPTLVVDGGGSTFALDLSQLAAESQALSRGGVRVRGQIEPPFGDGSTLRVFELGAPGPSSHAGVAYGLAPGRDSQARQ